jgi:hypothetical protein
LFEAATLLSSLTFSAVLLDMYMTFRNPFFARHKRTKFYVILIVGVMGYYLWDLSLTWRELPMVPNYRGVISGKTIPYLVGSMSVNVLATLLTFSKLLRGGTASELRKKVWVQCLSNFFINILVQLSLAVSILTF